MLPVDDPKDFNWEYPEKIHHEDLIKKTDDFIEFSLNDKKINSQQLASQRATFYLIFGILGSLDVNFPPVSIYADTELKIGESSIAFKVLLYLIIIII